MNLMTTHAMPQEGTSNSGAFAHPLNFVEGLRQLAARRPDDTALTVVAERDGQLDETVLTYRGFHQRVLAVAAVLQARFDRGDRVLILLDNDAHYAVSMFACFHAGVIAVPVFPPESTRPQHLARLAGIAADAQARGILTAAALRDMVGTAAREFGVPEVIAVDEVDAASASDWRAHAPDADDVAFLQYTSGSTSAPKGVMVTHGNLMANERAIREGLSIGPDDRFGVWSPLFHDMGLIGGLLQPFYSGIPCVLSSPRFFLERPVRWLEMIARHRVTISGGPDFAYRLCLDRVKEAQVAGLDLSSWRVAYTGAEPVRHDTMAAFVERYAPVGFSAGAVYPCYGLAEATLFVTGGRRGSGMSARRFGSEALAQRQVVPDADGAVLVGCGSAPSAHALRIADPQSGAPIAAGAIGEIWAAGPSIAAGYWNRPVESAATFLACDGARWLRTGDLGFVHEGELFVAGRLKDMVIVRGHNIYPQDIERVVEAQVDVVRAGRIAAFQVDGKQGEGIAVAAEVSRATQKLIAPERLAEAVSAVVGEHCGESPVLVLLLNPGGLPKTTSGKLQRQACRIAWQDGSLDAYAVIEGGQRRCTMDVPFAAATAVQAELVGIWCDVLQCEPSQITGSNAHFFGCGGTSLAAADLSARIAVRWSIDFSPADIFVDPRFVAVASTIDVRRQAGTRQPTPEPEESLLSYAQQRQWFLWRLDPASTVHHVSGVLHLGRGLEPEQWRSRFSAVVARHALLRTVFAPNAEGLAGSVVRPDLPMEVVERNLRDTDASSLQMRVAQEAAWVNDRPFDLTTGPLLRAALLQLPRGEQALVVVMHHIIADGASMQILVDELAATELAPLPVSYSAYAEWQRAILTGGEGARQLAWWRETLGPESPVLELPIDHARQARATYTAAQHRLELPPASGGDLRRCAAAHGTTPFVVMLAAFQALLFRYTGQHDIRVGAPVANRGAAEWHGLIGLLVNTLVLRNVVHGRLTLSAVLTQAALAVQGAMAHPDLPFEQLVEALKPERSLTHNPLVQVTINHVAEDFRAFERNIGTRVIAREVLRNSVQFDLTLEIREAPDGALRADFVYAQELFDADTVGAMANHWRTMLRAFVETPSVELAEVQLLDEVDLALLAGWSGRGAPLSARGVHAFVEQFAVQTPDAVAVLHGDCVLTYAELNRRANILAHRLIASGVGPERRVGIAVEPSLNMVVCLVATAKAGGAYVPLDPAYPSERLDYMMRDSGLALLLCESTTRECLPLRAELHVIEVDVSAVDERLAECNPAVSCHPENLAYVIYTSGSTGLPKGVAVARGPLASHLAAISEVYAVAPGHRELLFFSLSFDAAVEQWMTPLCGGGAIVLCDREELAPDRFLEVVLRHGVTTLHIPPAYLRVVAPLFATQPTSVRTCIVGGEAFSWADKTLAQQAFRSPRVVNAYGPTETLITPAAWVGEDRASAASGSVPIGTPVGARRAYVLDATLNPVPFGVIGELYVGGYEIARGYAGRVGLTAERFIADPFGAAGGRLYRTGDRARWHRDGHLEYFGRADKQVKVRGFRIELGEIEARLLSLPGVREGTVLVSGDDASARLIAYACPAPDATLDAEALRTALKAQLPDYMVPHAMVMLAALPLTPNGKIDRDALPRPAFDEFAGEAAPTGDLEETIAAIWREALDIPRVGRHDNFFDLGGHSLLLIQVHRRLVEQLALPLSLVDLFQHVTVSALAARAAEGAVAAPASGGSVIARAQRQRRHFLPRSTSSIREIK
jgi:amino acid adenylation domain-containing protein